MNFCRKKAYTPSTTEEQRKKNDQHRITLYQINCKWLNRTEQDQKNEKQQQQQQL